MEFYMSGYFSSNNFKCLLEKKRGCNYQLVGILHPFQVKYVMKLLFARV